MGEKQKIRPIIKNNQAISEEFTSIPALTIVMIGFVLFVLLIANTFNAYNTKVEANDQYQTAEFIATKITSPDSKFIIEGGRLSIPYLNQNEEEINKIRNETKTKNIDFQIKIKYDDEEKTYPKDLNPPENVQKIAITKIVSIYINEAQTKPGKMTIITWNTP